MTNSDTTIRSNLSPKELIRIERVATTAAYLFDKSGYHETSLKDISSAADLSKGAIYYYFSSKHEILLYIVDSYMDLLLEGLEKELDKYDDNHAKIKHMLARHLSLFSSRAAYARILLKYANNLPANDLARIKLKQKRYAQILTDILADNAGPSLDKNKLKACSYIVFGMYNSIIYWHQPDGALPLAELTEICCDLFLNGWKSFVAKNAKLTNTTEPSSAPPTIRSSPKTGSNRR